MVMLKKWVIILCFLSINTLFASENTWNGNWHVFWKSGSFMLTLEQQGLDVNGSFKPEDGRLKGKISDQTLHAVTFTENDLTRQLSLTMSDSKKSFFGSVDGDYWITGVREHTDENFNVSMNDLSSAKNALYSFLALGNSVRAGNYRALDKAMEILEFTQKQKKLRYANRLEVTQVFFHIVDECMVDKLAFVNTDHTQKESISLKQSGSDVRIGINFIQDKETKLWKIALEEEEVLEGQLKSLLDKRGTYEINPKSNLKLSHPRATVRTLFEQYDRWEKGGEKFVISTMNLSDINPGIHEWQAPLLAYYLKSVLNRISNVVFQEIPNDPKSKKPYIHFHHPIANIVIEPYEIDGQTKWQFSPQTLATIDKLYYEMENIDSTVPTKAINDNNIYFGLKKLARNISSLLLHKIYYTELWQILMLLMIFFVAVLVSYILKHIFMYMVKKYSTTKHWNEEMINIKYIKPLQVVTFGIIFLYGSHQLGLSNYLFSWINTFSQLLIIIGFAWIIYNLIAIVFSALEVQAKKTSTDVDEIILSLLGSVLRIVVIIIALFMIAEIFNIPYKTVLAGLGIGGLAFAIAAKDTIANFFGSAIIIADTPFKTGDKIKIGSDVGLVTDVGIRSTKIRTSDDTLLTIPNNKITHEVIDNYSAREAMRIDTEFFLDIKTPKVLLDKLDTEISQFLSENESVVSDKIILTGINDYTKAGISFGISFFAKALTGTQYSEIRHRIISDIAEIINNNGIEIIMMKD